MEYQALKVWVIVLGTVLGSWGSDAWAEISVKKIVFQGRGASRPEIQLVVTGSRQQGYVAQVWNGDYLWSSCQQKRTQKGKLSFECGRKNLKLDWRGEEYRNEGIAPALLTEGSGSQVRFEDLTAAL
ncbi:MAG: hypothetical protein KGQ59_11905, partial [Bdellovibrionales bacterium]|nr:hypothetical protein [Bdellovibrionales bacterium]